MKNFLKLVIAVGVSLAAGFIGSFFTVSSVENWYVFLNKPVLNPPSWLFGPVWTLLYVLMGIAAFLVWKKDWRRKEVKIALTLFAVQLILNSAWSIIFFGLQNPFAALLEIILLWVFILVTAILFYRISRPASYLFVPYIAWVSFAIYLNWSIWALN
ncbi:MAG: TspO/MBR family protein [Candidatus Moraniibacteriota bacterium]